MHCWKLVGVEVGEEEAGGAPRAAAAAEWGGAGSRQLLLLLQQHEGEVKGSRGMIQYSTEGAWVGTQCSPVWCVARACSGTGKGAHKVTC